MVLNEELKCHGNCTTRHITAPRLFLRNIQNSSQKHADFKYSFLLVISNSVLLHLLNLIDHGIDYDFKFWHFLNHRKRRWAENLPNYSRETPSFHSKLNRNFLKKIFLFYGQTQKINRNFDPSNLFTYHLKTIKNTRFITRVIRRACKSCSCTSCCSTFLSSSYANYIAL